MPEASARLLPERVKERVLRQLLARENKLTMQQAYKALKDMSLLDKQLGPII